MKKNGAALAAAIAVVLCFIAPAAEAQGDPATLDDLFELFDVSKVAADFVVVIDTSGSMMQGDDPLYPRVLDAYQVLLDSTPDGDFLSVLTFDSDPNLVFQDTLDEDSRTSARNALPETADGSHTDIGAAIDATLGRLERADSSEVQTVVFITDGVHDPPDGSVYPEKTGSAWDALHSPALGVADSHDLTVLGIGLVEGTDIGLLRTVFPNPQIVSLPPEQLPDFFEEAVRQSRLARLRLLVDRELDQGIRVRSTTTAELAPSIETHVTLISSFTKLPVTVEVLGATAEDDNGQVIAARVIGDEMVRIEPGGTVDVPILLKPDVSSPYFAVPPVTEVTDIAIELDATYTAEPASLLRRVTTTSLTGDVPGRGIVETSRTFGWSVARAVITAIVVLLALAVLWLLYRRFLQLPRLVGVFELKMPGIPDDERTLKLKGKRMVLDGANVPMAQTAKVKLFTRRGQPGHIWASVLQPPFYEVIGPHRERAISDEIEIRFGEYRLGGGHLQYRTRAKTTRKQRSTQSGRK